MSWKIRAVFGRFNSVDITEELLSAAENDCISDVLISRCQAIVSRAAPPKFLRITNSALDHWRPLRVKYGAPFSLKLNAGGEGHPQKIRIVYFINCYVNKNYIYLFAAQLKDLLKTQLLAQPNTVLFIVSSGSEDDQVALANCIRENAGAFDIQHEHHRENLFEYPGIKKVWDLGQNDREGHILYFHARGISHLKLGRFRKNRQGAERRLFRKVIAEWRKNLFWLSLISSADKVGMSRGGNGWLWYNFWWARSSYIAVLEKPEITERRHYYEDWLGRRLIGDTDAAYADTTPECLSIAASEFLGQYNIGSDFHPASGAALLGLPLGFFKALLLRLRNRTLVFFGRT